MVVTTPRDAIVVAVDSTADSGAALDWALGLAMHSHQHLHVVHAQPAPPDDMADPDLRRTWVEAGRTILESAQIKAESVPGVQVSVETLQQAGPGTAEALLRASRRASMLVLGAPGHGGWSGLLMGSISQQAIRSAVCPVITVRPPADRAARRVVIGLDESDPAEGALVFALELAASLRTGVTAIHAMHAAALHGFGVNLPMPADTGRHLSDEAERLADLLAPWEDKYPDVPVVAEVVPGHAAAVLNAASEHAAVVVVGSRGRGAVTGMLLGSVSQAVLHHAHCPVAVAP